MTENEQKNWEIHIKQMFEDLANDGIKYLATKKISNYDPRYHFTYKIKLPLNNLHIDKDTGHLYIEGQTG